MSQPFTAIATLIAKPGQQDLLEQGLRALVAPSRAEVGCSQYDLHRDLADPQIFYVIEHWPVKKFSRRTTPARTSCTSRPLPARPSNTSSSSASA
jgi:hypothetical protein